MTKETLSFLMRLLLVAVVLFTAHLYLISQFFVGNLYFPIWTIYTFNAVLVFIVYCILRFRPSKLRNKMYQLFLGLTIAKMALAIGFLSPLFFGKSEHAQLEVMNFFLPYFLFLGFEIFNLNNFFQKS